MATWNEIAYIIQDKLKLKSDDSSVTIDHIVFLMLQYRSILLERKYRDQKNSIPTSNYQTICVDIESDTDCNNITQVRSIQNIPSFTNLKGNESIKVSAIGDLFNNLEYVYTSIDRLPYVGNNKWLRNIIYFTTGTDNKLHLKSQNHNFKYLKRVSIAGMLDNPKEALALSCDANGNPCDYMETKFPLESSLVSVLIDTVYNSLEGTVYRPEDDVNDASDNLSKVPTK